MNLINQRQCYFLSELNMTENRLIMCTGLQYYQQNIQGPDGELLSKEEYTRMSRVFKPLIDDMTAFQYTFTQEELDTQLRWEATLRKDNEEG